MKFQVTVWDPLPVYRQGIALTLGGTVFLPREPRELIAWAGRGLRRVVVLTLDSTETWDVLQQLGMLQRRPLIIALLTEVSTEAYLRAVALGAVAALGRNAPPDDIRHVFVQATQGKSLLPTEILWTLVARSQPVGQLRPLSAREIDWLRALSQGVPVAQVAERMGYSERAMYRLLRGLYERMGVKTRTEAVLKASRGGWL
jgi:DNA-binding NarL/FixJ family response regulator